MSTPTAQRYADAAQPLAALLATTPPRRWGAPTPCEGWTAGDVVAHLIDTQRDFLARHGLPLGPAPDTSADPARAWADHSRVALALLGDPDVVDRPFDGYFGPTTIGDTMARFYISDMVVHRWDIARAVGGDERFSDTEMAQLEVDLESYGDAAYSEGVYKPALEPGPDADRQARLLARTGRRA